MKLRPSAAATWMRCPGQPAFVASLGLKGSDSRYAAEGRIAHRLAAQCLEQDLRPSQFEGVPQSEPLEGSDETVVVVPDSAFVAAVATYVDAINQASNECELFVEQELDLSRILQLEGQSGTGDAIIIDQEHGVLEIHDLKFGQGVPVEAKGNRQLLLYAAGAWLKFKASHGPFETIKMVIHQPRILSEPDVWTITEKALMDFIVLARRAAAACKKATPGEQLVPGEKQCKWCPAAKSARCPALQDKVKELVAQQPDDATMLQLGTLRAWVPLVQDWCTAVCDQVHKALNAGVEVPGWMLAAGRKGARQWADTEKASDRIKKSFRLKNEEMYDFKLKSPTQLEKVLSERRFQSLVDEGFIVQAEGKPTVVPASGKKQAIAPAAAFDNLDAQ